MKEMKFSEAIGKMKVGDRFKFIRGEILTMVEHETGDFNTFKSNLYGEYILVEPDLMVQLGKIITAEPVVLSAEEFYTSFRDEIRFPGNNQQLSTIIEQAFEAGDKNGRLERDLELRPIIEYCKKQVELNRHSYWQDLIGLIKNLKPLD